LAIEFRQRGIPFKEQQLLQILYKQQPLQQKHLADYVAYDKIIVEIKAMKQLGDNEDAQLLNYLRATDLRLGLLLNFGSSNRLQWKRLIL